MAFCLRQITNRLSIVNPLLFNGRRLIHSSVVVDRQLNQKDSNLFKDQRFPQLLYKKHDQSVIPAGSIARFCQASNQQSGDGASEEKLNYVYENLKQHLPMFFVMSMDYSIYHKDIVFENRIRGKTYNGIVDYVKQMSYFRLYGHFKYAYVNVDILKITQHTEDSSVKVRWRITGITGYQILFKMIQFRVWQPKEMIAKHKKTWVDGFSTFYVNKEGFIIRHIADKVMPDEDKKSSTIGKVVDNLRNVPKLALIVKLSTDITPVIT